MPEYYGNTKAQAISVFECMMSSLQVQGLDFGDVIKMTVFLVGDPALNNEMDFKDFMAAYARYFGKPEQRSLPARSAVQVAGLVAPLDVCRGRSHRGTASVGVKVLASTVGFKYGRLTCDPC
jgi:enamine deaminase RidA (YjgF/YER057c/UK114 family)